MATKKNSQKEKQTKYGKKAPEKKPLIDPRYKNFVSTIIVLILLIIFFVINNTRKEPESGPYPPFYKKELNN
ncbi:MAG TPA: hypothetical protein PK397_06505 [Ignavibacteriaceae bacterium]|jgi:uncharacterized integral membrane protein|nr:hypothetical protein [Ignavibacteriaceae bacterium]